MVGSLIELTPMDLLHTVVVISPADSNNIRHKIYILHLLIIQILEGCFCNGTIICVCSPIFVMWYVLSLNRWVEERNIQRIGLKTPCSRMTNNFYLWCIYNRDKKLLEPGFIYSNKWQLLTYFFTLWPFLVINKFNYLQLSHVLKLHFEATSILTILHV